MSGIMALLLGARTAVAAAVDEFFNRVTLLLPGNGTNGAQNNTFLDSSTNNFTITRNGNTTQGTFTPFSQTGWSGNFNTSTTYLTVTDTANLRFGSGNFTIEAWVYRSASGATQTIASKGASTPTGWVFQISSVDKLVFTDTSTSITGATTLNANTWYYVAVVRAGTGASQTTLYVNGTSDATGTSGTNFNQTTNMLIGADRSTTNFANGYISNLRLSNTNRTISGTPTSALTADANTIFLALGINRFQYTDSGGTYTDIAVTGSPSVQAFSPFAPTAAYSASTVGGSGYFDGTGDFLTYTTPSSTVINWYTNNFTVEAWIYPTTLTGWDYLDSTNRISSLIGNASTTATNNYWSFGPINTGAVRFYYYNGAAVLVTSTELIKINQWNHIAFTKTSSGITIFVNGVGTTATAISGTPQSGNTYPLTVGQINNTAINGYVSGVRIIDGTAQYSGTTYTIPTAPPTAVTNTSLLLNFTNAGITDATAKNDLETVGNAQISTTQSKFGGSSMYFDGTGDYLRAPYSKQWALGGDFTIEFWINFSAHGNYGGIVSCANSNTASPPSAGWCVVFYATTNNLYFETQGGFSIQSSSAISTNTWTHCAVVRSGSTITMYINGTSVGSGTSSATFDSTSDPLLIGIERGFSGTMTGYIDDLRITRYARYTANFTPPTAAFALQ